MLSRNHPDRIQITFDERMPPLVLSLYEGPHSRLASC